MRKNEMTMGSSPNQQLTSNPPVSVWVLLLRLHGQWETHDGTLRQVLVTLSSGHGTDPDGYRVLRGLLSFQSNLKKNYHFNQQLNQVKKHVTQVLPVPPWPFVFQRWGCTWRSCSPWICSAFCVPWARRSSRGSGNAHTLASEQKPPTGHSRPRRLVRPPNLVRRLKATIISWQIGWGGVILG